MKLTNEQLIQMGKRAYEGVITQLVKNYELAGYYYCINGCISEYYQDRIDSLENELEIYKAYVEELGGTIDE